MSRLTVSVVMSVLVGCGGDSRKAASEKTKSPSPAVATSAVARAKKQIVPKDGFLVGTTFKGQRSMPKGEQVVTLLVTKREETQFEGDLTIGGKNKESQLALKVRGKASIGNGPVSFITDKVEGFQQSFSGNYIEGTIEFECRGTTRKGSPAEGQGFLTRQN